LCDAAGRGASLASPVRRDRCGRCRGDRGGPWRQASGPAEVVEAIVPCNGYGGAWALHAADRAVLPGLATRASATVHVNGPGAENWVMARSPSPSGHRPMVGFRPKTPWRRRWSPRLCEWGPRGWQRPDPGGCRSRRTVRTPRCWSCRRRPGCPQPAHDAGVLRHGVVAVHGGTQRRDRSRDVEGGPAVRALRLSSSCPALL
jgi:hypothetical protein